MSTPVRYTLASLAGLVVAFLLVAIVEALGHMVHPPPADLDVTNLEQLRSYMTTLPFGALGFVLAAWIVGTFGGGLVAARLAGSRPVLFTGIIGVVILAGAVANLAMIPHPTWFAIAALVTIPLAAVLAARLSGGR